MFHGGPSSDESTNDVGDDERPGDVPPDMTVNGQRRDRDEVRHRVADLGHPGGLEEGIAAHGHIGEYPESPDPRSDGSVVTPQEEADDRNQNGVFPALSVRAHAQGWSSPGVNPYDHEDDEQDGRVDRSGHVSDDPSPDHRADDGHAGR